MHKFIWACQNFETTNDKILRKRQDRGKDRRTDPKDPSGYCQGVQLKIVKVMLHHLIDQIPTALLDCPKNSLATD